MDVILTLLLCPLQVAGLKLELQAERSERERQTTKAALKSEELRDVRTSLDKSLRTVGEDAGNLRTMLGKSLRRIDKYTETTRKVQPMTVSDLDTDQSNLDEEFLKANGNHSTKVDQSPNHFRRSSANLRTRRSLGKSPEKIVHQNGVDADVTNGHSEADLSPTRRIRRSRKSIN